METNKPLATTAAEAYEKFLVPAFQGPQAVEAIDIASPQPGEKCSTFVAERALPFAWRDRGAEN